MTREEALKILQREKDCVQQAIQTAVDGQGYVSPDGMIRAEDYVEACAAALSALRPVSWEKVEKVWRGEWEWYDEEVGSPLEGIEREWGWRCSKCKGVLPDDFDDPDKPPTMRFCPACGAPMTDKAVEMVMERLEALKDAVD